jgi:antitoxin VapB
MVSDRSKFTESGHNRRHRRPERLTQGRSAGASVAPRAPPSSARASVLRRADRLARELAARTGEGITEAVINALRERLERTKQIQPVGLAQRLLQIGRECAALPELDARSADEILRSAW